MYHCNKHEIFDNRLYRDRIHPLNFVENFNKIIILNIYLPKQREPTSDIYCVPDDFPGSLSIKKESIKNFYELIYLHSASFLINFVAFFIGNTTAVAFV